MLYLQEPGTSAPVSVDDVNQDGIGDCFLIAAIGELALNHPDAVTNMITVNVDGSETVRLYVDADGDAPGQGGSALAADPVTVDNVFPADAVNSGANQDVFDGQKEIWVQVLEKAVASINGGYDVLNEGGWSGNAMQELTGKTAGVVAPSSITAQQLTGDAAAGDLIVFDTPSSTDLPFDLVDDHSYMYEGVVSVGGTDMVQLRNPWGTDEPPLIPISQLSSAFNQIDVGQWTSQAPPAPTEIALAAASDSGTAGDGITDQPLPTFTGSAEAGTTVTLRDANGLLGTIGSAAVDQTGHWLITSTSPMPDNSYTIIATDADASGNVSAASQPFSLTIDTEPPAAPTGITLAPASDSGVAGDGVTNISKITVTGVTDPGVSVFLEDGTGGVGSTTSDQSGNWSITTAALSDGAHGFEAEAVDAAGNRSTASQPFYVTVDTMPPAAPASLALGGGNDAGSTVDETPAITGTGEANASVTVMDGGVAVGSAVVGADTRWSVTTSALALGHHSLTATETDVAGNVSAISAALPVNIVAPSPASQVTLGGGNQSVDAVAGQVVQAGDGSDTIAASAGQVTVTGGSGQLVFFGGSAGSSVSGGSGSAVLFGGAGGGCYLGGAAGHNVLVSQGEAGVLTTLTGVGADNQLFGSASGDDILAGESDRDSILGGGGYTTINGGAASVIFTGGGPATVNGGSGGQDTIVGGSGTLGVTAQDGDAMFGNAGALTVAASLQGADSIVGGSGALNVVGRGGNMLVVAGTSSSDVSTGDGASLVFAGSGNLSLTGGAGSMQVVAGPGNARIVEGGGPTTLQVVNGAAGGSDVLSGFRPSIDRVELFGYAAAQQSVTITGGSTMIALADGTKITLLGISDPGSSLVA